MLGFDLIRTPEISKVWKPTDGDPGHLASHSECGVRRCRTASGACATCRSCTRGRPIVALLGSADSESKCFVLFLHTGSGEGREWNVRDSGNSRRWFLPMFKRVRESHELLKVHSLSSFKFHFLEETNISDTQISKKNMGISVPRISNFQQRVLWRFHCFKP